MVYNLKKFEAVHGRYEERITLTKSYSFGLPSRFYNDNSIKNYKFAVLFWDAGNIAVGIHFTNDELEKGKFSIVHSKIGYGGGIAAKSFFRHNKIDVMKYHGRYDYEKIQQEGFGDIFVIKLTEKEKVSV